MNASERDSPAIAIAFSRDDFAHLKVMLPLADAKIREMQAAGALQRLRGPVRKAPRNKVTGVTFGSFGSHGVRLDVALAYRPGGHGHIVLHASNRTDRERTGIEMVLDARRYDRFKQEIARADRIVNQGAPEAALYHPAKTGKPPNGLWDEVVKLAGSVAVAAAMLAGLYAYNPDFHHAASEALRFITSHAHL